MMRLVSTMTIHSWRCPAEQHAASVSQVRYSRQWGNKCLTIVSMSRIFEASKKAPHFNVLTSLRRKTGDIAKMRYFTQTYILCAKWGKMAELSHL